MLDFWKDTSMLGDVNYKKHHANLSTPISTKSIGKWKNTLSEVDLSAVSGVLGSTATTYGYDV